MRFELPAYDVCSFCQDLSGDRECAFIVENEHAAAEVDERTRENAVAGLSCVNRRYAGVVGGGFALGCSPDLSVL